MIPVSTLYDEYIERRKFTEQKKPFEYIVPPPSRGSEQLAIFLILQEKPSKFFPMWFKKLMRSQEKNQVSVLSIF